MGQLPPPSGQIFLQRKVNHVEKLVFLGENVIFATLKVNFDFFWPTLESFLATPHQSYFHTGFIRTVFKINAYLQNADSIIYSMQYSISHITIVNETYTSACTSNLSTQI